MGIRITKHLNKSATPQTQPVSGKNQVKNNAVGLSWALKREPTM